MHEVLGETNSTGQTHKMSSEGPTPLPIVANSFSQQGTVDWVNLEQQTLSFSIGVLARLSSAGVDALTVSVGQAIFQNFRLGHAGRTNVQKALQSLRSYSSFGNIIWFGFGIRSLVRSLGNSNQGTTLLALCAAIGECFHPDLGAEVLHEITVSYQAPEHLVPSPLQWSALIKACSGVFATTTFPILAEELMSFGPSATLFTTYVGDVHGCTTGRGFPYPSDLAAALTGLCKVSCNEIESMSITGGPACGWLAAVAVWLLDLPVAISCDGQSLYSNASESRPAQVHVLFDSVDFRRMELTTKTYHLRDSAEFLNLAHESLQTTTMSGRLRWDDCLAAAFGKEFKELLDTPLVVGNAFGCAARIFKAIVRSESAFGKDIEKDWRSYNDAVSGLGFVENTVTWLPELKFVKGHMEEGAKMSLKQAMTTYEQNLKLIETRCQCGSCKDGAFVEVDTFCLATLFETIVTLSRTLASFIVTESINPSRAGLELFYIKQRRQRMGEEVSEKMENIGPIYRVLETTPRLDGYEDEALAEGLREGLRLFVGRDTFDLITPSNVSAISAGGICIYLDILRDLSLDKEVIGRVRVVRGNIERHGRSFDFVLDRENIEWCPTAPKDETPPDFTDISMIAEEKVHSLRVNYILKDKMGITVQIPPAKLVHEACLARGLVNCRIYGCTNVISIKASTDRLEMYELSGKQIGLARGGQPFRCALLFLEKFPSSSPNAHCILRTNECIQCCFRAAMVIDDRRPVLIIL